MVLIVGSILIKKMKHNSLLTLIKPRWIINLVVLCLFLVNNFTKVQAQSVPLDYDIPEDGISNPVTSPDETNNSENNENLDENTNQNTNENTNNLNEPIMIFVPPPDSNKEINVSQRRRSLSDILIIEEMLIPE